MELLKELSGFVVLTGPLFLIIIWLPVSIWAATKISKRYTSGSFKRKLAVGVVVFVAIFLAPFADEIAGRIYLNHLCATEAGVKVYETVELPAEYWDEEGRARFIIREGSLEFDETMLSDQYSRKSTLQPRSEIFVINRNSYQLLDNRKQSVVGEDVNFMYWGGWITRNFSANKTAFGCSRSQVGYFTDVLKKAFKPAAEK